MQLLSFTVSGFRNIAKTTIKLGGITALISPNNYGKSNLLDAINFAFEFIQGSNKQRAAMMQARSCVPLSPKLSNENFQFSMKFDNPSLGEYRFVRYGFSFSWVRDDGHGCKITEETLEINSKKTGSYTNYLRRSKGQYKKSHTTRSFRSISLNDTQLAIDVLTAIENIDINPAIKSILSISYNVCDSLDASAKFRSFPFELNIKPNDDALVIFDDEDLSRALFRLKKTNRKRYEDFLAIIYTLLPEFENVTVNSYELNPEEQEKLSRALNKNDESIKKGDIPLHIKNELYSLMIKSKYLNQPVDISYMSAGTKRIVWLIANVIIAGNSKTSCIGIEEIETSIHPRMTKDLLETLNENISSTSLLLTSHSPYLVQYLKPEKIYIGVPTENGTAIFAKIQKRKIKTVLNTAYNRGMGLGEYLFELMTSGDDGIRVLNKLLEL